jgi:hypothetical protein
LRWRLGHLSDARFVIPAIYHPASLIPLNHWLASPSSTNGNEQPHQNINRDGIDLTLLEGIMRRMHYDFRAMTSIMLHKTQGIYGHNQYSTDYRRSQTSISQQGELSSVENWAMTDLFQYPFNAKWLKKTHRKRESSRNQQPGRKGCRYWLQPAPRLPQFSRCTPPIPSSSHSLSSQLEVEIRVVAPVLVYGETNQSQSYLQGDPERFNEETSICERPRLANVNFRHPLHVPWGFWVG